MTTTIKSTEKLPSRFEKLAGILAPQAIMDDVHYENATEMIDRLMAAGKLTRGQELYMECGGL